MKASRRKFMLGSAVLGTAAAAAWGNGLSRWSSLASSSTLTDRPLTATSFRKDVFQSTLQQRFQVKTASGKARLRLTDVANIGSDRALEQFILTFEEEQGEPLAEGTYHFQHGKLGGMDIYLHPSTEQSHRYRATFSLVA